MTIQSNQYNYATPLSSASSFNNDTPGAGDNKYFILTYNTLEGDYVPIKGDVGIWGTSISDDKGYLSEPLVIRVIETGPINAFRLVGSEYNYPVDFTVTFDIDNDTVYRLSINNHPVKGFTHYMPRTLHVLSYTLTVTRISAANSVAMIHKMYTPAYIKRSDNLATAVSEQNIASERIYKYAADSISCAIEENISDVTNIFSSEDTLNVGVEAASVPTNVHTRMKEFSRRVYGKVAITYSDPMLANTTTFETSSEAYNSNKDQLINSTDLPTDLFFTLYDNDLTGSYTVSSIDSNTGWSSGVLSDSQGFFTTPQTLTVRFFARPVRGISVLFNSVYGSVPQDFTVSCMKANGTSEVFTIVDNTADTVRVTDESIQDVVAITISVTRVSRPYTPATVAGIPVYSTVLYKGYENESNLMSIDLLEELTYDDEIEALGGISANEITVALDNSTRDFFFNSGSIVSTQLKRNRKIEPWLGVEVVPGEIEWHALGTFWSYKWDVPTNGLVASVLGFDTIGLLGLTTFSNHHVQINKSIGELIEYVLTDAMKSLDFIQYKIDEALYDIVIPYAWFARGSHATALRKISLCYPMHIYCDRQGVICAKPQKLHLDYFIDEWSDSTNVIDKKYSSLYNALPNVVSVSVNNLTVDTASELVRETNVFQITNEKDITLYFNQPFLNNLSVEVVCDASIQYTYEVYAWGINIKFTGTGAVSSIVCFGDSLTTLNTSVVERIDEVSVALNGAQVRNVSADFIQTQEQANLIVDRIFSLSELDKYDAEVTYRGDISLTINDSIILHNGIAPVNKYNIKRHQLSWNGGLTGSADLNT